MPRLVGPHRQHATAHAKAHLAKSGHVVRHKAASGHHGGRKKKH